MARITGEVAAFAELRCIKVYLMVEHATCRSQAGNSFVRAQVEPLVQ